MPRFGRSDLSMNVIATCWWIEGSRGLDLCSLDSKTVSKRMNASVLNNSFLIDLQCSSCSSTIILAVYPLLARAPICGPSIRF